MKQGIAFARTLRALDADDFRGSKLWLLVAAILIAAWAWWMTAARIPQYESSSNVRVENGHVIAYFPPAALARIHAGQSAVLHTDGGAIAARVQGVGSDYVELDLGAWPTAVDVEVVRLSPAALALR